MLGRVHLHRFPAGQGGADRVGATRQLAPTRSGHETDIQRRFQRRRIALAMEYDSRRIGEDHDRPGLREEIARLPHDWDTRFDQISVALLQREERIAGKWVGRANAAWIYPGRIAAPPGAFDEVSDGVGGHFAAVAQEAFPRLHHFLLLLRAGRSPRKTCWLHTWLSQRGARQHRQTSTDSLPQSESDRTALVWCAHRMFRP